jgi:hypothetical protein
MAESLYRSVTGKPVSQGQGDADLASQTLSQSGSPEPRQELKAKIVKAVDEYMASGQYRGSNDSNDRQELLIQTAIESGILRNEAQEMFPPNAEIVMASAGAQL